MATRRRLLFLVSLASTCFVLYSTSNRSSALNDSSSVRRKLTKVLDPKSVVYKTGRSESFETQENREEAEIDVEAEKARNKWKKQTPQVNDELAEYESTQLPPNWDTSNQPNRNDAFESNQRLSDEQIRNDIHEPDGGNVNGNYENDVNEQDRADFNERDGNVNEPSEANFDEQNGGDFNGQDGANRYELYGSDINTPDEGDRNERNADDSGEPDGRDRNDLDRNRGDNSDTFNFPYNLPPSAHEWCSPPKLQTIDYESCNNRTMVNSVSLYGGLTNSLKIVLLGAILSFEEDRCFYVDESHSELLQRTDQSQSLESFINRYLEPIGIQRSSPMYKSLTPETTQERGWREVWDWRHNRRVEGQLDTLPGLAYPELEGHLLKRQILRRLFRLQPKIRDLTCRGLEAHGLHDEFMTFSVRQGDKMKEEHFSYATMSQYIEAAEEAVPIHFGGKVPMIFVATDDCLVMNEFRTLRPDWRFVSECDNIENRDRGFALVDMKDWTKEQTDEHFYKFFIELYAMATCRYFVGVIYTNVTWWAYFMRGSGKHLFKIIQTPGTEKREPIEMW